MYKKCFLLACAAALFLNVDAQNLSKDTIRNVELPAATIRESKSVILNEKSVTKIEKATLKRINQGQDIPYLLNSLSSVVVSSDAGAGTGYTGIRIRGADLTRINVTLNGVPVNDPESQATYFVNTPDLLSSVQTMEVSKGVGISKNGVGNFGAGIAINNLDVNNDRPAFSFQSDYGSFNTFKHTLRASTGLLNQKFIGSIRASSIKSDGYMQRSASDLKAIQATAKYLFSANTQLVLNYMKGKEKTGQAWDGVPQDSLLSNRTFNNLGLKPDGTYYDNQTDNYGQDYYQLFFDHKFNKNWSMGTTLFYTKGKGYYEEYRQAQSYSDYGLPNPDSNITETDLVRQLWLDNDFYGGRIYTTYLSKKLDAGLYLNYNQYKGKHFGEVIWATQAIDKGYRWYDLYAQKNDANVYGMVDIKPTENFSIFADLQYRNVRYTLNGFRRNPTIYHDLTFNFFNPKMKFTWRNRQHVVSLLAGIAQKEPNRDDIEAGITSLPRPEKLFNTEFSYTCLPNRSILLQANLFGMFYRDQLVLTGKINDVGAYTRTNIPNSYRAGIELEFMYKSPNKIFELNANLALSQNKVLQFTEYIDDYDNGTQIANQYRETDIAFSPNVIAGGRLSFFPLRKMFEHLMQDFSIDVLPKYVGKQYLDNTSNESRIIKAYFVNDVVLNCPLKFDNETILNFRTGFYNIFNQLYEGNGYTFSYKYDNKITTENYYYPQAGFRWMLGVGLSL